MGYKERLDELFKFAKSKEAFGEECELLTEANHVSELEDMVKHHKAKEIDGILVDVQTANLILQVRQALSPANRAQFDTWPIKKQGILAWRAVK